MLLVLIFLKEPTYEDMTLLSSLLGPAKPPVANREDVNSAGGTFTFSNTSAETYGIGNLERCLVCLSEYEDGEECRQLTKCKHIFHQQCIDEVSTLSADLPFCNWHTNHGIVVDHGPQLLPSLPRRGCRRKVEESVITTYRTSRTR